MVTQAEQIVIFSGQEISYDIPSVTYLRYLLLYHSQYLDFSLSEHNIYILNISGTFWNEISYLLGLFAIVYLISWQTKPKVTKTKKKQPYLYHSWLFPV